MLMAKNKDGVHKQIGFIKANDGIKREGTNPLSFNSKNTKKIDYTIYGGTKQNTYTGKNLFDFSSCAFRNISSVGTVEVGDNSVRYTLVSGSNNYGIVLLEETELQKGIYSLSANVIDERTEKLNFGFRVSINGVWGSIGVRWFEVTDETALVKIAFYTGSPNTGGGYVELSNIQFEKGSTAITSYEPYVGGIPSPNPNYPQEVVGVGERTGNLFDISVPFKLRNTKNTITASETGFILTKNVDAEQERPYYTIQVTQTGDYTLSFSHVSSGKVFYDGGLVVSTEIPTSPPNTSNVTTVYANKGEYITIVFSTISNSTGVMEISNIMLNAGSTPLPYEPYGYKIPVVTRGKNLLKLKDDYVADVRGVSVSIKNGTLTINGTATSSGGRTVYLSESYVLKAGTYTLSGTPVSGLSYCLSKTADGSAILATYGTNTFTLTEDVSVAFGLNVMKGTTYNATVNVMLELGTEATEYEPYTEYPTVIYHDRPIYSIGDYADYINSSTQKTEGRLVKELVLTGDENFQKNNAVVNSHAFALYGFDVPYISKIGLCTHLPNSTSSGTTGNSIYFGTKIHLCFDLNSEITTDTALLAYLKAQYEAGTPVKVYYVLAEPEVTEITEELPEIPLIKDTNVLSVNTEVSPSKLSVYRADTEIDCVKNAEGEILFERGFTREACNTLPLQFNGMGKNLKDYTIYGNTEQKTYTGKNLLDISAENWKFHNANTTADIVENKVTVNGSWFAYIIVPVTANTNYTLQYVCDSYTLKNLSAIFGVTDGLYNQSDPIVANTPSGKSFNSGERTEIAILFYVSDSSEIGTSVYSNIQLELGSTATSYEPYVGEMASPNPNYPQEVIAVGDRTPNLFDKNDCTVEGYINADGNLATVTGSNWFTTENYIKCSGVITLSTSQGLGVTTYVACYDKQKNLLGTVLIGGDNPTQNTVTLVDGTEYIKTCARDTAFADYMLNEGDTALPYEPYGYRVPITTKGKNILKLYNYDTTPVTIGGVTITIAKDGTIVLDGTITNDNLWIEIGFALKSGTNVTGVPLIELRPNSQYTLSSTIVTGTCSANRFWTVGLCLENGTAKNINAHFGEQTTFDSEGSFIDRVYLSMGTKDTVYDNFTVQLQLEYGDTATEYEPYTPTQFVTNAYLNEPIYKIGDYSDEINYKEKTAKRVVKELVVTGDENWQRIDNWFRLLHSDMPDGEVLVKCSHFTREITYLLRRGSSGIGTCGSYYGPNYKGFVIKCDDVFTSPTDFKAFLKEQYEAGTPVKIYYVLAEPVTESVILPDVPTLNGGNVLDVDTTVEPTLMTIDYKTEDPSPKPQALRLSNLEILTTGDGTVLETRM